MFLIPLFTAAATPEAMGAFTAGATAAVRVFSRRK